MISSLFLLAAVPPPQALPVLHEESVLASSESDITLFGSSLALDGNRLAVSGTGPDLEEYHVLRREGREWVSELDVVDRSGLPLWYAVTSLDGDRLLLSSGENDRTTFFRRTGGTWVSERSFFPIARWSTLDGDRLVITDYWNHSQSMFPLQVFADGAAGWELETEILPDAPQASGTCCVPLELSGNTLAFAALGASGSPSIQVYIRQHGQWEKQAELWPASGGIGTLELALQGNTLIALVQEHSGVFAATAYVFERRRSAWRETARLYPEQLGTAAIDGDRMVLGQAANGDSVPGSAFVVERDRGVWKPAFELRASDGADLGLALDVDGRTVAVSSDVGESLLGRVFLFRLPALPRVNPYGCGINPADSLRVLAGSSAIGDELSLGLANPLDPGSESLGVLFLSRRADPSYPCGTEIAGLGLDGGPGELLLRRDPAFLVASLIVAGTPGEPLVVKLPIPLDPSLVGHRFYAQGALRGVDRRWGLTTGLELSIGR